MSDSRFTAATKFDGSKPPMDLIPWEAMTGVAQVLEFGALKYDPHNWRKGFIWSRLSAACLRHVFAWLSGEDKDPESGLSHIDHAICCLMFLSAHIKSGLGKDDRACKLLGEPQIPAAHVPKHKSTGYQWHYTPIADCPLRYLDTVFVSREAATKAFEASQHYAGLIPERDLYLREVEIG